MSFKKPFRAQPVILGEYSRTEETRNRRKRAFRTTAKAACVAVIVFVTGAGIVNRKVLQRHFTTMPTFSATLTKQGHSKSSVYYRTCASARADGAAPILRGSPGYWRALDADGDGIACEPYVGR